MENILELLSNAFMGTSIVFILVYIFVWSVTKFAKFTDAGPILYSKKIIELIEETRNYLKTHSNEYSFKYTETFVKSSEKNLLTVNSFAEQGNQYIRIFFKYHGNSKFLFSIKLKSRLLATKKKIETIGELTYDKEFDDLFHIRTSNTLYLDAYFDYQTRMNILNLGKDLYDLEINERYMRISYKYILDANYKFITKYIDILVEIEKRLIQNFNLFYEIENRILTEKNLEVQLYILKKYILIHPYNPNIFLRKLLSNKKIELQIESAKHLKEYNHLLKLLKNSNINDELLINVIQFLKKENYQDSISYLQKIYLKKSDKVKKEILNSFRIYGNNCINDFLIKIIDSESKHLQRDIVNALGTCGKINAINTLISLYEKIDNSETKSAIKNSLLLIQHRLGDIERGWLSNVENTELEGILSFDDNIDGAISIADDKE